jgi:hypothetical protein
MPALGGRKPSELMAAMLETCPRGEEKTNLFACIFLQRLPREIRVLLAKADHKDPKTLATQADELWALHDTSNGGGGVAAVQESPDSDFVAAISGDRRRGGGSARGKTRGGGRGRGGKAAPRLPEPEASKEARLAAGLCIKHWRYGEAASSCEQPCSWQGNGGAGGN